MYSLLTKGYSRHHNKKIVTLFSAPNYCYKCGNQAAIMEIDDALNMSYTQYSQATDTPEPSISRRPPDYFL